MKNRNVLVSGASVAGPALAYWLGRRGFNPTVVEIAPTLRTGGYAVDFRGATHLTVLKRMGVFDDIHAVQTGGTPLRFVDKRGRQLLRLPSEFAGGDIEVLRADLSRVLHEHSRDMAEYIFGDTVTGLTQTPHAVDVTFEKAPPRTFDLVIGADGIHSAVRRLGFGPESQFVRHLGYHIAGWDLPNYLDVGTEALMYNVPGKLASVGGYHRDPTRAATLFVFASERQPNDRQDLHGQKKLITDAYAGVGWEVPSLIASLRDVTELYFDALSRVDVPTWVDGRLALVGDAACGATLGGMGTGFAIVAAYVLAGELDRAHGDHTIAFPRYEATLREYALSGQKGGSRAGPFLAPRTRTGITLRNRALGTRFLLNALINEGKKVTNLALPDYPD